MKKIGGGWQFRKFFPIPLARIATVVWLSGSLLFLWVQMASERRFRRRLLEGREEITLCGQRAYKVRGISTPLLFRSSGFSLDVYIPEGIVENERLVSNALLHENAHKRHGDIWWGYLRNLLLAAYWFHPLVWVAAVYSKRDCEFACDSSVIGRMSREERISYGNSLLSLVQAGGEGGLMHSATLMSVRASELKKRICLIKGGRKRGVGATVLMAAMIAGAMVCTFTDAKAVEPSQTEEQGQETREESLESSNDASAENPLEPVVNTEPKESLKPAVTTLPQTSSGLTMEKLLNGYHSGTLTQWTFRRMSKYQNMSKLPSENGVPFKQYTGVLPYQGVDYQVWLRFRKEDAKLNEIYMKNVETGEADRVYSDQSFKKPLPTISPEEFFHHENMLDEEISYTLPEGLLATEDRYSIEGIRRMFCREEKEKHGLYGMKYGVLWNSTGGLMSRCLKYRKKEKTVDLNFKLYGIRASHNDRQRAIGRIVREFRGGKLQNVDGCENMTSLQGLVFTGDAIDSDTLIWYRQSEAGNMTKKKMKKTLSGRKLWIICVADEEKKYPYGYVDGYVFFFDAERYTKEQMVALAKSIHLK